MRLFFLILFSLSTKLFAQNIEGLDAYFTFDDVSNNEFIEDPSVVRGNSAKIGGPPTTACGVKGKAYSMDGVNNFLVLFGPLSNLFSNRDFSISMYIRPKAGALGLRDIFSKMDSCNNNQTGFSIKYNGNAKQIIVDLKDRVRKLQLIAGIDQTQCWQHIVFTRAGNKSSLYINGTLRTSGYTNNRVQLTNNSFSSLSNGPCINQGKSESRFNGLIDELKLFKVAINEDDVRDLYIEPDHIKNRDTIIYKGSSVQINLKNTCDTAFNWTPNYNISDTKISNPVLSPEVTTTYKVQFLNSQCSATDTIQVLVVDPNSVDCNQVFFPTAFTPNDDGLNDSYGISNPYAIKDLISFEIYDKWGGNVFKTTDPFAVWDGKSNGSPLNPGVFLYRVAYRCNNEEKLLRGSFTLLK